MAYATLKLALACFTNIPGSSQFEYTDGL